MFSRAPKKAIITHAHFENQQMIDFECVNAIQNRVTSRVTVRIVRVTLGALQLVYNRTLRELIVRRHGAQSAF